MNKFNANTTGINIDYNFNSIISLRHKLDTTTIQYRFLTVLRCIRGVKNRAVCL